MTKKLIIGIIIFFSLIGFVFADTIKLKSNKIIEGNIIERTDKYIKVDVGIGVPITYFLDDIESIGGKEAVSTESKASSTQNDILEKEEKTGRDTAADNTYRNESLGITMTGPQGWYLNRHDELAEFSVIFSKFSYSEKFPDPDTNPIITLQGKKNVPLDYSAERQINALIKGIKEDYPLRKLEGSPIKLTINNIEWLCIKISTDILTEIWYSYFKDGIIYNIMAIAPKKEFEDYHPIFEKVINSVEIK